MAFSQQSYTGQGITQQNVVDQSGQNIARGIEAFGEGLSRGIRGRAKAKSQAASLRSKLLPHADSLAEKYKVDPGNWKAFLDDQGLGQLQGISEGYIVSMAKELHDQKVTQNQLAINKVNQTGAAVQGILQANMPGDVPVDKHDYTDQIGKAKAEEERLAGMMRFAPKPEGSMETDESLRQIQQRPSASGATTFDPVYAQFVRENVAPEGQRNQFQKQAAQSAGLINENYAQSMAGKAAQAREALGQLHEEISKPLEDVRNQLEILEEKQSFEQSKPDSRPETAKEFSARRTKTLKKLIDDNPLAATTIYAALMGSKAEAPKLDAEARKAVGFADRMDNAEAELSKVMENFDPSGSFQGLASVMPNIAKSEERQMYEALALDWITANLRRESGAAIGEKEYENDLKKYFPAAGDSAETVKLKESLRQQAVKSIMGPIQSSYPTLKPSGTSRVSPAQQSGQPDLVKVYGSDGNLISR
ncbi:hypothetical protein [uncultured Mediterranean phage uvMED]|nr:hypothetical protein [uncultured Mediterranean phage uvMED]